MTPDGLLISITPPTPGCHHDVWMVRTSGLREKLDELFRQLPLGRDEPAHFVYGDLGYFVCKRIICGWKKSPYLTAEQKEMNKAMSSARVCVEWGFSWLKHCFPFVTVERNYELLRRPCGKFTMVCAILLSYLIIELYYRLHVCSPTVEHVSAGVILHHLSLI